MLSRLAVASIFIFATSVFADDLVEQGQWPELAAIHIQPTQTKSEDYRSFGFHGVIQIMGEPDCRSLFEKFTGTFIAVEDWDITYDWRLTCGTAVPGERQLSYQVAVENLYSSRFDDIDQYVTRFDQFEFFAHRIDIKEVRAMTQSILVFSENDDRLGTRLTPLSHPSIRLGRLRDYRTAVNATLRIFEQGEIGDIVRWYGERLWPGAAAAWKQRVLTKTNRIMARNYLIVALDSHESMTLGYGRHFNAVRDCDGKCVSEN